jgi:UDP-N-acetylmuramoyl-L-alanyl-D-glutamate--2,6-diaminopimelate ligase
MTTPDPVRLQAAFRQFVDHGAQACAMEASSIGLAEHRLVGTRIRTAVFTNFTQDHLDYHGSMESYWQAKRQLFDWPGLQAAIVNIDDPTGTDLASQLQAQSNRSELEVWTVSAKGLARIYAVDIHMADSGLAFTVVEGEHRYTVLTQMVGHYNVLNLLCVIAVLRAHGCGLADAVDACAYLQPVDGRMQRLLVPGQPLVAVDYAHTPDALAQALQALRLIAVQRGGRLWCVFGCGGNRDASKRPLMGAIAQKYADECIITSDNPRQEDPAQIAQQIVQGLPPHALIRVTLQRSDAITQALAEAHPADVVMLAGKGHADSQELAGIRTPFSDMQCAKAALAARHRSTDMHKEGI